MSWTDATETSSGSSYTVLEEGANKLRIISEHKEGWVKWGNDGTPERVEGDADSSPGDDFNFFWACKVYNYRTNNVELWSITQKGIRKEILELAKSADWGDPQGYDLTIKRTGTGMNTSYSVQPSPAKELSKDVQEAIDASSADVKDLFLPF